MLKLIKNAFIFLVSFLIFDACLYFSISPSVYTIEHSKAPSTDAGKIFVNASGDQYLYLRYNPIKDRFSTVYKFELVLMPRKEDATRFIVELSKMKDEKGNVIEKTLFDGNLGCYYLANVKTPDNKYLVFVKDINDLNNNSGKLQALDKVPFPDSTKYAWLVFHHYGLNQYFFQPIMNDYWYLQRMQHAISGNYPMVDVLPFSGNPESTGKYFIYWKLED